MTAQEKPSAEKPAKAAAPIDRREAEIIQDGGTAKLHLTMATADYDHIRDLVHGVVRADGIALTPFVLEVEEIFHRFIKHLEWDVSEVSFAKYTSLTAQGAAPMVAIPVFPSRVFRHSSLYVRTDRGIADREGPGGPHDRHPGMGADRRHLRARPARRVLRGRPQENPLGAGRGEPAGPGREGGAQPARRHPLRGAARREPQRASASRARSMRR